MHGCGRERTANQGRQQSRQRDRTVEPPFMLAFDTLEGKFREQIDQQPERRERLILGRMLGYRRGAKPPPPKKIGLWGIAPLGGQRTTPAHRRRGGYAAPA